MKGTRIPATVMVALALLATGLLTACSHKDDKPADKDAKWLGSYKNSKDGSSLVLQTDHKGTLDMGGTKGDVTWEVAGDDKIVVHAGIPISMFQTSEGLRDEEGTVWKKT